MQTRRKIIYKNFKDKIQKYFLKQVKDKSDIISTSLSTNMSTNDSEINSERKKEIGSGME